MEFMVCDGVIKNPTGDFRVGVILAVTLAAARYKRYPLYLDEGGGRHRIGDARAEMRGRQLWMFDVTFTPAGHAWVARKGGFYAAPAVAFDGNREIHDVTYFLLAGPVILV